MKTYTLKQLLQITFREKPDAQKYFEGSYKKALKDHGFNGLLEILRKHTPMQIIELRKNCYYLK